MDFVVIGLSGKAHAGKSETRKLIKAFIGSDYPSYEFKHMSFAAKLKEIAYELFGWDGVKDLLPEEDKGRRLLINIGTLMRQIRPTVWADFVVDKIKNDILLGQAHNTIYVIDDLRFQNELEILRRTFGNKFFWAGIKREGIQDIDSDSEKNLDSCSDFDAIIYNHDLNALGQRVKSMTLTAIGRMKERLHV